MMLFRRQKFASQITILTIRRVNAKNSNYNHHIRNNKKNFGAHRKLFLELEMPRLGSQSNTVPLIQNFKVQIGFKSGLPHTFERFCVPLRVTHNTG